MVFLRGLIPQCTLWFWEISKNTFFTEHFRVSASEGPIKPDISVILFVSPSFSKAINHGYSNLVLKVLVFPKLGQNRLKFVQKWTFLFCVKFIFFWVSTWSYWTTITPNYVYSCLWMVQNDLHHNKVGQIETKNGLYLFPRNVSLNFLIFRFQLEKMNTKKSTKYCTKNDLYHLGFLQ